MKTSEYINMRLFIVVLSIVMMPYFPLFAEERDCIQVHDFEKSIALNVKRKVHNARVAIKACYTADKKIYVDIRRAFFTGNELLDKQKATRQNHQLFLQEADHSAFGIYKISSKPESFREIGEGASLQLIPVADAEWQNLEINFSLKFLYSKGKDKINEVVTFNFSIPDNFTEKVAEEEIGEKEEKEVVQAEPIQKETVIPVQKEIVTVDSGEGTGGDQVLINCLDSVIYYYHQLFEIYNKMGESETMSKGNKNLLSKHFVLCNAKFNYYVENCDAPERLDYNQNYNSIKRYLQSGLDKGSKLDEVKNAENNKDKKKGKSELKVKLYDTLLIVLSVLFIAGIVLYFYKKINKKRKKK